MLLDRTIPLHILYQLVKLPTRNLQPSFYRMSLYRIQICNSGHNAWSERRWPSVLVMWSAPLICRRSFSRPTTTLPWQRRSRGWLYTSAHTPDRIWSSFLPPLRGDHSVNKNMHAAASPVSRLPAPTVEEKSR